MFSLAVLGSGKGSNFQAILDAIDAGQLDARICCVIADVADAFILERARRHGIPAYFVDCAPSRSKLEGAAEKKVIEILQEHQADYIALAGFMRIIKDKLLQTYPKRIINIHPALLPAFPGLHAWKQALHSGAKVTGCTVHFVDAGVDTGPIIIQRTVPVLKDDTAESLHKRIQEQEYIAYPEALRLITTKTQRL